MEREELLKQLANIASELNQFEQVQSTLNKEYGRDRENGKVEVTYDRSPEFDRRGTLLSMPKTMFKEFVNERVKQLQDELTKNYDKLYPVERASDDLFSTNDGSYNGNL